MRKASNIIYLVAAIVSVVCAVLYLVVGIVFTVLPNTDAFVDFVKDLTKEYPDLKDVEFDALKTVFVICGVGYIVEAALAGVNSFLSFKARREAKPSKALNVVNIVFGVLSGVIINIVAAIFAFVANGQEERNTKVE